MMGLEVDSLVGLGLDDREDFGMDDRDFFGCTVVRLGLYVALVGGLWTLLGAAPYNFGFGVENCELENAVNGVVGFTLLGLVGRWYGPIGR